MAKKAKHKPTGAGAAAFAYSLIALAICAPMGMLTLYIANKALEEDEDDRQAKAAVIISWMAIFWWISLTVIAVAFVFLLDWGPRFRP